MGRKTNTPVGTLVNGWEVLARTHYPNATNQQLSLKCLVCGTPKTAWAANLKQGRISCGVCSAKEKAGSSIVAGTVIAYYTTHLEILPINGVLPAGVPLYRVVSDSIAVPLVTTAPELSPVPEPDKGYKAYLRVPTAYLPYYTGEDIDEQLVPEAEAFWEEHVVSPTKRISSLYKGSQSKWVEQGVEYAYLYWKDLFTWPKGFAPPPQPSAS